MEEIVDVIPHMPASDLAASIIALGIGLSVLPTAWADDDAVDPGARFQVQVAAGAVG